MVNCGLLMNNKSFIFVFIFIFFLFFSPCVVNSQNFERGIAKYTVDMGTLGKYEQTVYLKDGNATTVMCDSYGKEVDRVVYYNSERTCYRFDNSVMMTLSMSDDDAGVTIDTVYVCLEEKMGHECVHVKSTISSMGFKHTIDSWIDTNVNANASEIPGMRHGLLIFSESKSLGIEIVTTLSSYENCDVSDALYAISLPVENAKKVQERKTSEFKQNADSKIKSNAQRQSKPIRHCEKIKIYENKTDLTSYKGICFIDFGADWCAPCHKIASTIDVLADEYSEKALFYYVDVDKHPDLVKELSVKVIPSIICFQDGKEIGRVESLQLYDEKTAKEAIDTILGDFMQHRRN